MLWRAWVPHSPPRSPLTGYRWSGTKWESYTLTPRGSDATKTGQWILGEAQGPTLQYTSATDPTYFAAYSCHWVNNTWKCGCQTSSCTQPGWQLQAVRKPYVAPPTTGGGDTTGGGSGTGGGGSGVCAAKGLSLVWESDWDSSLLGQRVSPQLAFGASDWNRDNSGGSMLRTFGRAPDGRISIQYNIPRGTVDGAGMESKHLTPGTTQACVEYDWWVPEDFQFPTPSTSVGGQCSSAGKGRWEMGLWSGPGRTDGQRIPMGSVGGGTRPEDQRVVPMRINRASNNTNGQDGLMVPYVYNLNRNCPSGGDCYSTNMRDLESDPTPRGRWFTAALYARMNDRGQDNGCIEFWVDGKKTGERCGLDLGRDRGYLMQGIVGFNLWHCNGSPKEQKMWSSNIKLYGGN